MQVTIDSFSPGYVLLSFLVSVFGSYTALRLAIRIPAAAAGKAAFWVLAAAVALGGGGIWSMHFIGMVAYQSPMPVTYDLMLTIASMVVGIVACAVGLLIVGRSQGELYKLLLGGLLTGLGVSSMHYMGMEAMIMAGEMSYDRNLVIASIVIGIVAATAALWLAFNMRGGWQRIGAAVVMGLAVCGMHYTGMFAMSMTMSGSASAAVESGFSSAHLATMISAITAFLLIFLLIIDHQQRDHGPLMG